MKLLLGILLALVLIEGVGIVGLYLKLDQQPHALITRAGPPTPVEAAPSAPVTDLSADQSRRFEEFTAKLEALRAEVESLRAAASREQVQSLPSTLKDLQGEEFKSAVRELSVQAVQDAEEQKRSLAFQDKAPQHAAAISDKWPVRFGTVGDLEKVLVEWYSRLRPVYLKYSPTGKMPTASDPNYDEWISEFKSVEQWGVGELQRLYGTPLDPDLEQSARHLVYVHGTAPK